MAARSRISGMAILSVLLCCTGSGHDQLAHSAGESHAYLQELMRAGFGKRLMFGSDFWGDPAIMERAIEGVESATLLSDDEKRDIFQDNASRLIRLTGTPAN
jgi:predicted TIM-barrel fold metal-dependent hydrolase